MAIIDAYKDELQSLREKYRYSSRVNKFGDTVLDAGAMVPPVVRARMRKLINYINRARYGTRQVSKVWAWLDSPSLQRCNYRYGRIEFNKTLIKYRNHGGRMMQDRGDYVA